VLNAPLTSLTQDMVNLNGKRSKLNFRSGSDGAARAAVRHANLNLLIGLEIAIFVYCHLTLLRFLELAFGLKICYVA
jgi:hypothetical protein